MKYICIECEKVGRTSLKRKRIICPTCYYRQLLMEDYPRNRKRRRKHANNEQDNHAVRDDGSKDRCLHRRHSRRQEDTGSTNRKG